MIMKPQTIVFPIIKTVAQHILLLILLLSIALISIIDGCVPENTPAAGMCTERCDGDQNQYIYLSDCHKTTLFSGSYSGGSGEVDMEFLYSGITRVSRHAFSGYTAGVLSFVNDSIVTFEDEAFADLTVERLSIQSNPYLTSLPTGVFRGIKGLKGLHLTGNEIRSLPYGIFRELPDLKWLYLDNNNLKSLPAGIFDELTGLTELSIKGNSIGCFRWDLFHPLQSLEGLYMKQEVDIEGLCPRTFKGLGLWVKDYKIDGCIVECGKSVDGLEVIDSTKPCNCNSTEGCLDCSAANRVSRLKSPSWRMAFIFYQVMLKIRQFDF